MNLIKIGKNTFTSVNKIKYLVERMENIEWGMFGGYYLSFGEGLGFNIDEKYAKDIMTLSNMIRTAPISNGSVFYVNIEKAYRISYDKVYGVNYVSKNKSINIFVNDNQGRVEEFVIEKEFEKAFFDKTGINKKALMGK